MRLPLEGTLLEKLRKIEALHAARRWMGSGKRRDERRSGFARLSELRGRERASERELEYRYTLPDPWKRKLFLALCRLGSGSGSHAAARAASPESSCSRAIATRCAPAWRGLRGRYPGDAAAPFSVILGQDELAHLTASVGAVDPKGVHIDAREARVARGPWTSPRSVWSSTAKRWSHGCHSLQAAPAACSIAGSLSKAASAFSCVALKVHARKAAFAAPRGAVRRAGRARPRRRSDDGDRATLAKTEAPRTNLAHGRPG